MFEICFVPSKERLPNIKWWYEILNWFSGTCVVCSRLLEQEFQELHHPWNIRNDKEPLDPLLSIITSHTLMDAYEAVNLSHFITTHAVNLKQWFIWIQIQLCLLIEFYIEVYFSYFGLNISYLFVLSSNTKQ